VNHCEQRIDEDGIYIRWPDGSEYTIAPTKIMQLCNNNPDSPGLKVAAMATLKNDLKSLGLDVDGLDIDWDTTGKPTKLTIAQLKA